jgi:ethylbenzene dioxygenase subunit alpha
VWVPKGPGTIELHSWVIVNKDIPAKLKDAYRRGVSRTFSPGGILEMDDGENWEHCTKANTGFITRQQKLHYGLGLDSQIEHDELKGNVFQVQINDANQRAFYQRWADLMSAESWSDVPQR